MTPTKANSPLWKVLNEKRTQGDWRIESYGDKFPILKVLVGDIGEASEITHFFTATMDNAKEQPYNARYTALAVNNLHHLAEALQHFANLPLIFAEQIGLTKEVIAAKEALARIS